MIEKQYSTDVVIIGAGPVGLFAVFQLGMLKIKCHVIDSLEEIGGQCRALYPEKPIYDIPAYPQIMANDLIEKLEAQASPFKPQYHLNQEAVLVKKEGDEFTVITSKNTEIKCKAVIIAAGSGAFGPNRPPLENLEEYEGKSVFYMIKNRSDFTGKTIVIAGGGDSAVDWAVSLAEIANKIYFIHRRDKFRAAPESVDKLHNLAAQGKIEILTPYQLHSLKGEDGQLQEVTIQDMDGNNKTLEADLLLPFFGITPKLGSITNWGINIDNGNIKVHHASMETNVKGVFAIGDVASYEGKLKLILSGFSDAAHAAHSLYPIVFKGESLHFVHSTDKGIA